MSKIIIVLTIGGVLMTLFTKYYLIGWAISFLATYKGLFLKAAKLAESKEKELPTDLSRHEVESRPRFLFRRFLGFAAWGICTLLSYWIILPLGLYRPNDAIEAISEGFSK